MSDVELQNAYVIGPRLGGVRVVATSTSVAGIDLSTEFVKALQEGRMIRLEADTEDVYWFLNSAASGTPDPTATTGDGRCALLKAGAFTEFFPEGGYSFVRAVTASGSGYLRAYVSSKPPVARD